MTETLEIRELGGREVTLILSGRGLPHKPFTLTGTHVLSKSRPMGSPYKTHQATGFDAGATTLTGEWASIYLTGREVDLSTATSEFVPGIEGEVISISSTALHSVAEAAEAVDDLVKRGALVRVSWAHIVRVGRIEVFDQKWATTDDLEWSMTLDWIGTDETTEVSPPASVDATADMHELVQGLTRFVDATTYPIENIEPAHLDVIDRRVARIHNAALELGQAIRTRVDGATTAVESFRRALSVFTFVGSEAELLALEIDSRISATWIADIDTPEDLTKLAGGQVLAVLTTSRIAARAARAMRQDAARRRFANLQTLDGVAAIYLAREGDDLHSIARAHYGTEDAWVVLRDFNSFTSASVEVGTVVLAPPRQMAGGGW